MATSRTLSYDHKRGDTFTRLLQVPAEFADGFFVGWVPRCQVRTAAGALVAEVVPEWLDAAATRNLKLRVADTTGWPLGAMELDVQFTRTADGEVMSTTTASFTVGKDVTQ